LHRTVIAAIQLARPAQWVKNIFVFAALVFACQGKTAELVFAQHGMTATLTRAFEAFFVFCLLSSAVYAFNDLMDRREDALHPTKRHRPVASGAISPGLAGAVSVGLAVVGTWLAAALPQSFAVTAVGYLILNMVYTLWGKHRVILDVILIAIGFVMRALAGAQAIEVPVSAWLAICTFTLCLFLGFGKRRCELANLGTVEKATSHRATLASYTPELLTQLLSTTGGIAVITFLLYTLDPNTPSPRSMVFTTPLVFYAIFRYALVIGRGQRTGPTDVLVKDKPFLLTAIAWTIITLLLIFRGDWAERYLPQLRYPGESAATAPRPGS
jgi:4-hydroxybenzoate polyprenyltransferase